MPKGLGRKRGSTAYNPIDVHITESFGTEEMEMIDPATQGSMTVGDILLIIIQQLVLFLGSAVSVAALSLSYRHATQHREHGPAHAAGADRRVHPPKQQIDPRGPGAHL